MILLVDDNYAKKYFSLKKKIKFLALTDTEGLYFMLFNII